MYRFVFLLLSLFLSLLPLKAQVNLDSLRKSLPKEASVEHRLDNYLILSSKWLLQNQDSSYFYLQKLILLSEEFTDKTYRVEVLNQWANYLQSISLADSALFVYDQSFRLAKKLNYTAGLAKVTNNIALIALERGDFSVGLSKFYESLAYEEELGNEVGKAEAYNNIGVVFYYQQDYDKSLEYLKLSLRVHQRLGNISSLKQSYTNIGAINEMIGRLDSALIYYEQGLKIAQDLKDLNEIAVGFNNMAGIYESLGKYQEAERYYKKSLAINKTKRDDKSSALNYLNLATLYQAQNKFKRAFVYFEKALEITKVHDYKKVRSEVYQNLKIYYQEQGNFENSLYYSDKLRALDDTLFNETKSKTIAEAEMLYETAKKDTELAEQEAELVKEQLKVKQKNQWLIILGALISIVLLFAAFSYCQHKLKEGRLESEALLKQERAKADLRGRMEEERLRIARDLHDHIGTQLTIIGSNIDNLAFMEKEEVKRIKLEAISDHSRDTMHQLRETIWAMNVEGINLTMLVAKLEEFFRRANSEARSMQIRNSCEQDLVLSPNQTIALFRISQEAANNAIKYAQFKNFVIDLRCTNSVLRVSISDDGVGMDVNQIVRGYGLDNMAQRAKDIGASFKLSSERGKGFAIIMEMSLEAHVAIA
jgi:signal transduction histidine kinase